MYFLNHHPDYVTFMRSLSKDDKGTSSSDLYEVREVVEWFNPFTDQRSKRESEQVERGGRGPVNLYKGILKCFFSFPRCKVLLRKSEHF